MLHWARKCRRVKRDCFPAQPWAAPPVFGAAWGSCIRIWQDNMILKNLEPQQLASVELEALRIAQTELWSLSYFHLPLRKNKHWSLVKKNLIFYLPEKKTIRVWSLMEKHRIFARKASLLSIWEIPHQSITKKHLLLTKKASDLPLREREREREREEAFKPSSS
jgi:hypothetical protein